MGNVQTAANAEPALWPRAPSGDLVDLGRPHRTPLGLLRLQKTPKGALSRREAIGLGVLALVLHAAVIYWVSQKATATVLIKPPEVPPMTIEFSQPAPPAVEPPPPPPPPPVVQAPEPPPPPVEDELATKPSPKVKPKPVPKPVVKKPPPKPVEKPVIAPTPAPPQPVAAPAPPAPPAPKPVTPPSASAGYLKNPAPEYPELAQRRGWEGTVLLRVHVLASGKPGEVQVQTTSGRQQLDDAALQAVKRWSFVPAKQGDVPQDGWVSVPIDFKIR